MREVFVAENLYDTPFRFGAARVIRPDACLIIFSISAALALATASECHSITHLPSLLYGVTLWMWWGLLASSLWMAGRRLALKFFSPKAVMVHLCLAPLLAWLHLLLLWSISFTAPQAQRASALQGEWRRLMEINRFGTEMLIYGFIIGAIGAIQYHVRSQQEAFRSSELQRQLAAAQLQALQMQLEPHFLFNTLNAITTLVELERSQEAAQMLAHLNVILKTTLASSIPQKVPVSKELEVVDNYLAIEQVRFADRLTVEFEVDQGALRGLVPSFLLQPIVENAVRHGIARCEGRGLIETSIRRDGDMLRLMVRDRGHDINVAAASGNGIGLKNTRQRLIHFYKDQFEMKAEPTPTGGFEVAISIPYEQ